MTQPITPDQPWVHTDDPVDWTQATSEPPADDEEAEHDG